MHVASTSHAFDDLNSMVESDVTVLSQHPNQTSSAVTSPWTVYDEMSDSNICEEFSNSSSLEEANDGLFQNLKITSTTAIKNSSPWPESNVQYNDLKTMERLNPNESAENGQTNGNICFGCQKKIEEQYLLNISGMIWHESCAKCYVCDANFTSSCFLGGRRLYCKKDYDAIRKTCGGCKLFVHDDQLVVRIVSSPFIYHVTCFFCTTCKILMQTGDEFVFNQGIDCQEVKCKNCWENKKDISTIEKQHHQAIMHKQSLSPNINSEIGESLVSPKSNSYLISPKSNDNDVDDEALTSDDEEFYNDSGSKEGNSRKGSQDNRLSKDSKKSKRPRTILNAVQRRAFKIAFELTPKPCRKVREKLAHDTGLTVRVVQVWFQNQRAKVKKIAKRHHTQEVAAQKAREELGLHMFDSMMPIHYLPSNTLHGCDISMDMPYVQMHHQKHFSNIQQGEMLWDYQREEIQHSDQQNYHGHAALYRPHTSINSNTTMSSSAKENGPLYTPKILPHHQDTATMLCSDVTHPNMDVSSHSGNDVTGAINGLYSMQNHYFNAL